MIKAIFVAIILAAIVLAAFAFISYVTTVDMGDRVVSVFIAAGDNFEQVAGKIVAAGVVRSGVMLRYPAQWRGIDRKLTPGRYDFTGKNSCRSVLGKLERGDVVTIRVTIYEGAPIWKVASILSRRMEVDSAEIVRLNRDPSWLAELGVPSMDGYLFPETYFFRWGTSTRDMLKTMVQMFRAKTDTVWPASIPNGLSRQELIVLASIVEAEALLDAEKPQIASVYHNRIRERMKLDADPTVIYGLGGLNRPLTRRDIIHTEGAAFRRPLSTHPVWSRFRRRSARERPSTYSSWPTGAGDIGSLAPTRSTIGRGERFAGRRTRPAVRSTSLIIG
jgi:UPF0755 protein